MYYNIQDGGIFLICTKFFFIYYTILIKKWYNIVGNHGTMTWKNIANDYKHEHRKKDAAVAQPPAALCGASLRSGPSAPIA